MKIYQADSFGKIARESIPEAVKAFYHSLIEGLDQTTRYCRWEIGAHPSGEMVQYAIDLAKRNGKHAIRLDVLHGNLPAEKLYTSLGFRYADALKLYYECTGWADFELYEYLL